MSSDRKKDNYEKLTRDDVYTNFQNIYSLSLIDDFSKKSKTCSTSYT